MNQPNQKSILVTGGSRGIGRAIVERLVRDGYRVFTTGTKVRAGDPSPVEGVRMLPLSLESDQSRADLMAWLRSELAETGLLYGLVNNAAICETAELGLPGPAFREVLRRVLSINLEGPAFLAHELLAHGLLRAPAAIVNVASQLGVVGRAGYSAYGASKAGLISMTETWSRELGPKGFRVNAVCPGWIETEMTASDLARLAKEAGQEPAAYRAALEAKLDQRRFNTPSEVAAIVAFLLSPDSSGITGRTIEMAGPSA